MAVDEVGGGWQAQFRELVVRVDALDRLVTVQLENVNDKITAQKVNVDTALTAQKEQTAAAFAASEKAIDKAEIAQKLYNTQSNEFRQSLDDSNKNKVSRDEFKASLGALEEKLELRFRDLVAQLNLMRGDIQVLRDAQQKGLGGETTHASDRAQSNWVVGIYITGGLVILSVLADIVLKVVGK